MSETVHIPTDLEALKNRLEPLYQLLTAKEWERAAIVYAFTESSVPGRGRWYKPEPPKVNLITFAELGFTGLTTPKAVRRYRRAWEWAVEQSLVTANIHPGDVVELPEEEFPAWNSLLREYDQPPRSSPRAPVPKTGVLAELDVLRRRLDGCAVPLRALTDPDRIETAAELLDDIGDVLDRLRAVLRNQEVTAERAHHAQERWKEF